MSDANRAHAALRDFIAELNAAWEAAGPPSFARLEKLSISFGSTDQAGGLRLRVLAASTTHEILRGKRRSLPEWGWVVSFVKVLRFAAAENGLDPDAVGTIAGWKAKHQRARAIMRTAGPPPAAAPAPAADHDAGPDSGSEHDPGPDSGPDSGPDQRGPPADRAHLRTHGVGGMAVATVGTSGTYPFFIGRGEPPRWTTRTRRRRTGGSWATGAAGRASRRRTRNPTSPRSGRPRRVIRPTRWRTRWAARTTATRRRPGRRAVE